MLIFRGSEFAALSLAHSGGSKDTKFLLTLWRPFLVSILSPDFVAQFRGAFRGALCGALRGALCGAPFSVRNCALLSSVDVAAQLFVFRPESRSRVQAGASDDNDVPRCCSANHHCGIKARTTAASSCQH